MAKVRFNATFKRFGATTVIVTTLSITTLSTTIKNVTLSITTLDSYTTCHYAYCLLRLASQLSPLCWVSLCRLSWWRSVSKQHFIRGNCDICMKQKILVINETKQDKIVLKLKVYDWENLHVIPWTFVKVMDESYPTFSHFSVHEWKLTKLSQYLTAFPSHFNIFFLNLFGLLMNLIRNC